jgi:hypothetical protein
MSNLENIQAASEYLRDATVRRDDTLGKAYSEGYTLGQVAVAAGLNSTQVRNILLAQGLVMRPRGTRSLHGSSESTGLLLVKSETDFSATPSEVCTTGSCPMPTTVIASGSETIVDPLVGGIGDQFSEGNDLPMEDAAD